MADSTTPTSAPRSGLVSTPPVSVKVPVAAQPNPLANDSLTQLVAKEPEPVSVAVETKADSAPIAAEFGPDLVAGEPIPDATKAAEEAAIGQFEDAFADKIADWLSAQTNGARVSSNTWITHSECGGVAALLRQRAWRKPPSKARAQ